MVVAVGYDGGELASPGSFDVGDHRRGVHVEATHRASVIREDAAGASGAIGRRGESRPVFGAERRAMAATPAPAAAVAASSSR